MSLILPRRAFTSGPSVECRVPATLETEFLRRDRPQRVFRLSRPRRQFAKADVSNFYDDLLRVSPHKPWNLDEFKQQLEEVRSLKEGPAKLEAINRLYNSVASRFTVYKSLLAEIQREYALILESGMNQRSEREYLLTKIRKLMGETLDEATLKNETERLEALEAEVRRIAKQSKRIRERAKEEDCFFLKTIGDIFVKESESSHDTRRRGKKTFIQEWLVKNLSNEKVVAHELLKMLENEGFDSDFNFTFGTDHPKRKHYTPAEAENLLRMIKRNKADCDALDEKIEDYQRELSELNKKIQEVEFLLPRSPAR